MGTLASGCGAVELIGSLIGVNRGLIPPVLNCDEPDPACALDVVRGEPRPTRQADLREHECHPQWPGCRARGPGEPLGNRDLKSVLERASIKEPFIVPGARPPISR